MQIGNHHGRVVQAQSRNQAKMVRGFAPCCRPTVEPSHATKTRFFTGRRECWANRQMGLRTVYWTLSLKTA